jgi:hypothetical protein
VGIGYNTLSLFYAGFYIKTGKLAVLGGTNTSPYRAGGGLKPPQNKKSRKKAEKCLILRILG